MRIVAERAVAMTGVPGGGSGMLVRTYKTIGKGVDAVVKEEYAFDAALSRELRETLKQFSIEAGQWAEKRDLTSCNEPMVLIRGVPQDQI
jgi:hypothetical protein